MKARLCFLLSLLFHLTLAAIADEASVNKQPLTNKTPNTVLDQATSHLNTNNASPQGELMEDGLIVGYINGVLSIRSPKIEPGMLPFTLNTDKMRLADLLHIISAESEKKYQVAKDTTAEISVFVKIAGTSQQEQKAIMEKVLLIILKHNSLELVVDDKGISTVRRAALGL